jgi:hypothetical protein
MNKRAWEQMTNTMPARYGVFVGTTSPGCSEVWTRVGPALRNVHKAAQRAIALDPRQRGAAEVRDLTTNRTVYMPGIGWILGDAMNRARAAVEHVGRDYPGIVRVVRGAISSLSN